MTSFSAEPSRAAVGTTARTHRGRPEARARILAAADSLAREVGAANISLEAVAERAGVSKGGLLYHFPTKAALLRTVVADHVARLEAATLDRADAEDEDALIEAVLATAADELGTSAGHGGSGTLAAIAEDPQMIDPMRDYLRRLVESLKGGSSHPDRALIAFFALEGMRAHSLFEIEVVGAEERRRLIRALERFVRESGPDAEASGTGHG